MVITIGCLLALQGCAAVGLSLVSAVLGTVGEKGVAHTLDGAVTRTFTVPVEGLHKATLLALQRMDMPVTETRKDGTSRETHARAGNREVVITLDRFTSRTTRMDVVVKRWIVVRDRSTASEIIAQTDQILSKHPNLVSLTERPVVARPRDGARVAEQRR